MEKSLMAVMALLIGVGMFIAVAQMVEAAPPVLEYTCPICGAGFATYEELYSHFTTEHPAEPIDVIWE